MKCLLTVLHTLLKLIKQNLLFKNYFSENVKNCPHDKLLKSSFILNNLAAYIEKKNDKLKVIFMYLLVDPKICKHSTYHNVKIPGLSADYNISLCRKKSPSVIITDYVQIVNYKIVISAKQFPHVEVHNDVCVLCTTRTCKLEG